MGRTKNFNETEVLQRAQDLFWSQGYHATSIQDLVDHLGINRASIYGTWGDKHNLYLESLKLYRKGSSNWLLELVRSDKPARQIIQDFLNFVITPSNAEEGVNGCFLVNSTTEMAKSDQDVTELVNSNRDTVIKVLTAIIDEGKEDGDITSHRPSKDLASYLFGVINGLRVMAQTDMDQESLKKISEIAISSLD